MCLILGRGSVITMDWLIPLVFLFGTALGSFANVVDLRIYRLQTILIQRSQCPHCHHPLAWFDLIPIGSFVVLRGRCRYCGKPIHLQYPLVELAVGILAVVTYSAFGISVAALLTLLALTALVILFVHDLKTMRLPDVVILGGLLVAVGSFLARHGTDRDDIQLLLIGSIAGVAVPGILYLAGKGKWMGFGDVKLGAFLGLFLGWPLIAVAFPIAFLTGAVAALVLVFLGKKSMQSAIPFGPFLVLGATLALFFGERLLVYYHRAFL